MYYNCTYNCIRIRLTHRLVRKILRAFEKHIKDNKLDKTNGWLMINNYNLLRNMWKHPNATRFIPNSHRDKFNKKIIDRRMFVFNDWKIFLSTNNWSTIHMAHKSYKTYDKCIDTIIKYLLTKPLDCPF
jgi:hypothetical protein